MTNKTIQTQANILLTLTSQYCTKKKEYYYIVQARMRDMTAVKKSRPTQVHTSGSIHKETAVLKLLTDIGQDLIKQDYI